MIRVTSLSAVLILLAVPVSSQPANPPVGSCDPATAEAFLDIGNVRAKIMNNGGLFWNGGRNVYEVPKGSGIQAIFNTNIWIGGQVNGQTRVAATNYGPYEFWPGPLADAGDPPDDCSEYDRIWMLERPPVLGEPGPGRASRDSIRQMIAEWPVDLGAPYVENNGTPGYQPFDGDRSAIRGDQMAWWIMNDAGNAHEISRSDPLGVEVRGEAFAFSNPGGAGALTIYRYTIINRSRSPIDDVFVAFASDTDFGHPYDDVVGTDTSLGLVYTYNADNYDEDRGAKGYGEAPPAIGTTILERQLSSAPDTDPPSSASQARFDYSMMYYDGGRRGSPYRVEDVYEFMQGIWKDGTRLTAGGDTGYHGDEPTNFIFPGDPVEGEYWSGMNFDGQGSVFPGGEIRMMGSTGPMQFAADDTLRIAYAVVWARGADHLDSVDRLREITRELRQSPEPILRARPVVLEDPRPDNPSSPTPRFYAEAHPNPSTNVVTLNYNLPYDMEGSVAVYDALGRRMVAVESGQFSAGPREQSIDVSSWPAGVYVVRYRLDHVLEHIDETRTLVVR